MRDSRDRSYTMDWLQVDRPQPMYDQGINQFYDRFYRENPVHEDDLDGRFKSAFLDWLDGHRLSRLEGYHAFGRLDVTHGCTQYIDDIYQRLGNDRVMIFRDDYKYHWRLNNDIEYTDASTLERGKELLISMPFPSLGDVHPDMDAVLDRCHALGIPVHVDGAWISCSKGISFNFDHPAIETFCISLSKGGMGGNRIGLRFSRDTPQGAITIMNDFGMNPQALMSMGIRFMEEIGPEYFWRKYESHYQQVCRDFNLKPTKAVHLARTMDGDPVGIRPLLRCLHDGTSRQM